MALEAREMKALFQHNSEPRTIPKEPTTSAMEPRDRRSFPRGSIFGVPRKMAAPPVDLDYPHWSDPVRLAECHFFDPPPRFDPPKPRQPEKVSGSQASGSTRASSSRSGSRPDSKKSGGRQSRGSERSRDSKSVTPLTSKNVAEHVRETKPWGGSNASSENKKEKQYFASIESVYEIRMGCRKLDGTPIAHGRAGIPSAKLRDKGWTNFYNNPQYGGPYYRPKTFGYSGGTQAAGISTGGQRAHG
eukprot:gnl/MRDRNA2_/MRDRNA2_103035_c0_seq1.p1 gnl/MRDRNA2_/MRDRNA2_103035_c0~~gnl/MRDRNA2_/MRDRNA2_103035_c0_seq1.p1  ORF type:complete len:245 (+),score=35.49 gnl/MRDRNA2_/MRDRNA2_103035_c0_seq1:111-845(+)